MPVASLSLGAAPHLLLIPHETAPRCVGIHPRRAVGPGTSTGLPRTPAVGAGVGIREEPGRVQPRAVIGFASVIQA